LHRDTRRAVEMVLLLSTLVSALVSAGLGLYFVRGLTGRVSRLVANTVRLQNREPLAQPLPGNDELAFVDQAFYAAATKLVELERFKQEMVSVTSHELRTPLTSLLAFADLMSAGLFGSLSAQGEKVLRGARRRISELIAMITNLLDTEKMQSGKVLVAPQQVNLETVFSAATASVSDLLVERDIALESESLNAQVKVDAERLSQALSAILTDVAAQLRENSSIKVNTVCDEARVRVRITTAANASDLSISHQARSRLSINLSQLIAQQHGGQFVVDSDADKQVYTFDLPA
jgi:signal transduction histidine kinase